ncbi:MAG TPA: type I DNA topoisomerase [Candidatus Coprenecus stercoravium]|uniref:DNA topoisomerase 1 n=1 Tax=Candidatus Coprenecus stercoravium TaxID=2840735 RepID=A0A9D2GP93_9BACT|nr:type I DNA topoisomerase [Candidatus Coprenecus stercoravium]
MENLVIVESPAKAKTIEKILGKEYTVKSSFGHIRDLSKKNLGIDVEHGFEPRYEVSPDKKKVVSELKAASGAASTVWLASDEDREGEAIAWHLKETLDLDPAKTRRIVFHEITKDAILNAIKEPRDVDMNLVMAQQARRVLDRLVGFELSPILWKKIKPSLSAGRVQSVALRLVVEREREISAFRSNAYYRVEGVFVPENLKGRKSSGKMTGVLDRRFDTAEEAMAFLSACRGCVFTVRSVEKKEVTKCPAPPFTTSSLQQEAARKCGFSVSQTMSIAQHLYESGLITYMRTDSTTLSKLAIGAAKTWITGNLGAEYHKARQYKTGIKGAQEAHEAIRPTDIANTDIDGTAAEKKLYHLIWKRTVASQMADARLEKTDIVIGADGLSAGFDVTGSTVLFDGFLKLYIESTDDESAQEEERLLPPVEVGDIMLRDTITALQKYTAHPPRYSEASLVKKMEELGIGRPSTYAPTISTLHQRGYIIRQDRKGEERLLTVMTLKGEDIATSEKKEMAGSEKSRLCPQDIGVVVTDFLEKAFPSIMDYGFTAKVEANFDKIAAGKLVWNKIVADFYEPFHEKVVETTKESAPVKSRRILGTDPATGKPVIARMGRYGSVAQIGEDDDPEKRITGLEKGMLIESVTLEEVLRLFSLPRTLGEYDGKEVICSKGKFGPYVKYDGKYVSLKKGMDPYTVSLDVAVKLIQEHDAQQKNRNIKKFEEEDIEVLNGRFGPYIKHAGANYKIPKGTDPTALTLEDCLAIVAKSKK